MAKPNEFVRCKYFRTRKGVGPFCCHHKPLELIRSSYAFPKAVLHTFPHFHISSMRAHSIWCRTTKFGMMTPYLKGGNLRAKPPCLQGRNRGQIFHVRYIIYAHTLWWIATKFWRENPVWEFLGRPREWNLWRVIVPTAKRVLITVGKKITVITHHLLWNELSSITARRKRR